MRLNCALTDRLCFEERGDFQQIKLYLALVGMANSLGQEQLRSLVTVGIPESSVPHTARPTRILEPGLLLSRMLLVGLLHLLP